MNNNGQCCVAAKRFIVVDKVADQFIAKFQAALEALTPGDPMEASTTVGPLCSETALLNLLDQLKRSVAAGARVLMGGGRLNRTGAFMQPSILTDIK
jgi:succinate-semialdehyde dehydrogenase/glutarate-semialdehyde dehydrogenase